MKQMRTDVAHIGTLRYLNEFVRLRCSLDLLDLRLFPDMKEVTESFAAYAAARDRLGLRLDDPSVVMVAVGDGHTPRTAATFAFRSAWTCYSVDPRLTMKPAHQRVRRLTCIPLRIEDAPRIVNEGPVVIAAVHSHAPLDEAVKAVDAPEVHVIALPCCVPQSLSQPPSQVFEDEGVWSPKREVRIWSAAYYLDGGE